MRWIVWGRRIMWGLWWLCTAFVVVCLVGFGWAVYSFTTDDDPFHTIDKVDCSEAVKFAGASLPERMSDEDCTSYSRLDQDYDGSRRMPRADVVGRLEKSYPRRTPTTRCLEGDELCLDVDSGLPQGVEEVRVSVVCESGDTALAHLEAYST
ncbi:hypothetical protein ACWEWI_18290 [Streptomyces sp. NPDC003753]